MRSLGGGRNGGHHPALDSDRYCGYRCEDGLVVFDEDNPSAWVWTDLSVELGEWST